MSEAQERSFGAQRDPALTGVRAMAIALVLLSHIAIAKGLPQPWLYRGSGQLGVMLFFLLSGYLMARIYGARVPDRPLIGRFALARTARVLPAYLVVIAISMIAARLDPTYPYQIRDWQTLLSHVFMIEGQNALWAVPVEVQFYGVFLIVWAVSRGTFFPALVALALPLSWVLAYAADLPSAQVRPLAAYMPYFVAGAAMGLWLPARVHVPLWLGWVVSGAACLALALAFPFMRKHFGAELPIWRDPVVFASMALVFGAAIWRLGVFSLLTLPIAVWIGTISYGVYLWNPVALYLVGRDGALGLAGTPLAMLGLSLIFGLASWLLVERPVMRRLRRSTG